jgi:hypothetical protein
MYPERLISKIFLDVLITRVPDHKCALVDLKRSRMLGGNKYEPSLRNAMVRVYGVVNDTAEATIWITTSVALFNKPYVNRTRICIVLPLMWVTSISRYQYQTQTTS